MSLDYFADSGQIIKKIHTPRMIPSTATNKGLHLETTLPPAFHIDEARNLEDPKELSRRSIRFVAQLCR